MYSPPSRLWKESADYATSLQSGMGFTSNQAILLSAPVSVVKTVIGASADSNEPLYYAVVPALISSRIGDSECSSLPRTSLELNDTYRW